MPSSKFVIERKCAICGKTFYAKTLYSRYCCKKCTDAAYRKRCKEADEEEKRKALVDAIPNDRPYITIKEAAAMFKVSYDTIYRLVRLGRVPSITLGPRTIRVDRDALQSFVGKTLSEAPKPTVDEITPDNSYSIGEISAKFGINASTVYEAIRKLQIPTKQIGRFVYVPISEIDKLIKG